MRGSCWIFVDVTTLVTSMASLTRKPRSKYWFACFRDVNGKQRRRPRNRRIGKKPSKLQNNLSRLDDVNLLLGQSGKASPSSIGKSTAIRSRWRQYANSLPTGFRRKNRKYLLERLHFTKRASPSFSSFWALLPTWILAQ
jgi:hypothetical protein